MSFLTSKNVLQTPGQIVEVSVQSIDDKLDGTAPLEIPSNTFNSASPYVFENTGDWQSLSLYITPNGATLTFDVSVDNTNWSPTSVMDLNNLSYDSVTATGNIHCRYHRNSVFQNRER